MNTAPNQMPPPPRPPEGSLGPQPPTGQGGPVSVGGVTPTATGGRFDFDDGGTYCGGWEDGKAHGHGVCTGPKGQGEYSGSWHYGFEVSGIYTWPSGSAYEGQWQNGKRHGLGVETRGRWAYRGEWTQGFKGRYGVRQSLTSGAKYEGTWANGLQDGYGSETYADGGIYQGQWMRGMRHGYGVRSSAPFGLASHYRPKSIRESLTSLRSEHVDPASERDRKIDDCRGGFVLKARSDEPPPRRRSLVEKSTNLKRSILQGLRIKKQRSTGDIDKRGSGSIRSTGSNMSSASSESSHSGLTRNSAHTDSNISFVSQDDITDANVIETYMGEWKNDKRCGFGIAERSDGLKYEGEWYNNKKYGYGVTTFKDGTKEEGKYKNNVLVTSGKKKHLFLLRSAKFKERIESAVSAAIRGSQIALQKADIAISRTATARGKAEQADIGAMHAREDSDIARLIAKQFAPDFHQLGTDLLKRKLAEAGGGRGDSLERGRLGRRDEYGSGAINTRSRSLYIPAGSREAIDNQHDYSDHNYSGGGGGGGRDLGGGHPNRQNNPGSDLLQGGGIGGRRGPPGGNYLEPSSQINREGSMRRNRYRNEPGMGGEGTRDYTIQQAMNDHFDQYRVEPNRASSSSKVNQRGPAFSPQRELHRDLHAGPSLQRSYGQTGAGYGPDCTPDSGVSESMDNDDMSPTRPGRRSTLPNLYAESFQNPVGVVPGLLSFAPSDSEEGSNPSVGVTGHEEDSSSAVRKRAGPAEAPPIVSSPIRTPSLHVSPTGKVQAPVGRMGGGGGGGRVGGGGGTMGAAPKRKKSLPDIAAVVPKAKVMSREEVAALSSMRREEIRRRDEEAERIRANPLLYLLNPDVKDWFSRQQLVMLVLFINISLAIMFFKLLT